MRPRVFYKNSDIFTPSETKNRSGVVLIKNELGHQIDVKLDGHQLIKLLNKCCETWWKCDGNFCTLQGCSYTCITSVSLAFYRQMKISCRKLPWTFSSALFEICRVLDSESDRTNDHTWHCRNLWWHNSRGNCQKHALKIVSENINSRPPSSSSYTFVDSHLQPSKLHFRPRFFPRKFHSRTQHSFN